AFLSQSAALNMAIGGLSIMTAGVQLLPIADCTANPSSRYTMRRKLNLRTETPLCRAYIPTVFQGFQLRCETPVPRTYTVSKIWTGGRGHARFVFCTKNLP